MNASEPAERPEEMGELEKWGRAAVSAPVVTSLVVGYLTDKTANTVGVDSASLDPLASDVTDNLQLRADWVEGHARSGLAKLSGAKRKADAQVEQISPQWRSAVRRFYSQAASDAEVDAIESGMRDGFTGSMRHYEISGAAERRSYLRVWAWSRGWFGRMAALRNDVRSQVGLRLAEIGGELASQRRRDLKEATTRSVRTSGTTGPSEVELLKVGLRSIASYAEGTTVGLEATLDEIGDRIRAVDALVTEAGVDGRNLTDHLMHAKNATRAAADALLLAADASAQEADRL